MPQGHRLDLFFPDTESSHFSELFKQIRWDLCQYPSNNWRILWPCDPYFGGPQSLHRLQIHNLCTHLVWEGEWGGHLHYKLRICRFLFAIQHQKIAIGISNVSLEPSPATGFRTIGSSDSEVTLCWNKPDRNPKCISRLVNLTLTVFLFCQLLWDPGGGVCYQAMGTPKIGYYECSEIL